MVVGWGWESPPSFWLGIQWSRSWFILVLILAAWSGGGVSEQWVPVLVALLLLLQASGHCSGGMKMLLRPRRVHELGLLWCWPMGAGCQHNHVLAQKHSSSACLGTGDVCGNNSCGSLYGH